MTAHLHDLEDELKRFGEERDRYRDALSEIALTNSYGTKKTPSQRLKEVTRIARKAING